MAGALILCNRRFQKPREEEAGAKLPGANATVTFDYDSRGRLIGEVRDDVAGGLDYDYAYEYDQGGNRTLKTETNFQGRIEVRYTYDYEDPAIYGSDNNRLMFYERYQISSGDSEEMMMGGPLVEGLAGPGAPMAPDERF